MSIKSTYYRVYPDGEVVHQDDFAELDGELQVYDDYMTVVVPEVVEKHIMGCADSIPLDEHIGHMRNKDMQHKLVVTQLTFFLVVTVLISVVNILVL